MILNKDLREDNLAETIMGMAADPEALSRMEKEAAKLGKPRAAEEIIDNCYELLGM